MKNLIITLILIISLAAYCSPFADVPTDHWSYEAVRTLVDREIMTGLPDGSFSGKNPVTRYEMAVVLRRCLNSTTNNGFSVPVEADDLKKLETLCDEYSEELYLLGVRNSLLEKEFMAIRHELDLIREEIAPGETPESTVKGNVAINGDITLRFEDYGYRNPDIEAMYNRNYTEHTLGLNLEYAIDPDVMAFTRFERYGYWNTSAGDFTSNRVTGAMVDSDLVTCLAYLQFKNPFGLCRTATFGRQHFSLAHNLTLNGVADGIYVEKHFHKGQKLISRNGAMKYDDADPDNLNDNEGIDLYFSEWRYRLNRTILHLYSITSRDPQARYSNGADTANRISWYGFGASGKPRTDLYLFGEYCQTFWDEKIRLDNAKGEENGDYAFLVGADWKPWEGTGIKLQYTRMGELFYRPDVWDTDTWTDAEGPLYHSAGYASNFSNLYAEINHDINYANSITLKLERIEDRAWYGSNVPGDDRDIMTGVLNHQYSDNTSFALLMRRIWVTNNSFTAPVANGAPHGADFDNFGNVSANATILSRGRTIPLCDSTLFRLEMYVEF